MKNNVIVLFALLTIASLANASGGPSFGKRDISYTTVVSPFLSTTASFEGTSGRYKEVVEAQEDISYFVASEGEVRTARFENALAWVKQNFNTNGATDLQIANEMLALAQ